MIYTPAPANDRGDLSEFEVMLVNADDKSMAIMLQVFTGFGVKRLHACRSAGQAMEMVKTTALSLIVCETALPETDGYAFVHWLRRSPHEPNRSRPLILVASEARLPDVIKGRDCGANLVVTRPISSDTMLQRIHWLGREPRRFIESETYCGPDRRYHNLGPPPGVAGRRSDDLSAHVSAIGGPNLSQNDIDNLFQARVAQ
jgi:CheY-like chemotaxis protein